MFRQTGFDFTQLDAQATDLHLEVIAPQVFDVTVGQPAAEVTGPVKTGTWVVTEWILDEPLGCQLRKVQITPCNLNPADVNLSGDAQGDWLLIGVEQVDTGVGNRFADRRTVRRF
ncbi:hypothetical protein ALO42_200053 [Pseudomonas syringae pv. atrofaciens]|nr:hypothetical protein ALO42_200053 [Pseudomonas syringae pv. atrofaciens]